MKAKHLSLKIINKREGVFSINTRISRIFVYWGLEKVRRKVWNHMVKWWNHSYCYYWFCSYLSTERWIKYL